MRVILSYLHVPSTKIIFAQKGGPWVEYFTKQPGARNKNFLPHALD